MKAIVDDKIPYIREAIEALMDEVVYLPGKEIAPEDVRDADVLIVRTRTYCNRGLLEGSRVRFIATATIGFDHIDTDYLREADITWTNCPGCNATSVAQYVLNALFLLEQQRGLNLREATLGIVGVGHVGTAVLEAVTPYVGRILLCDPPREEAESRTPTNSPQGGELRSVETSLHLSSRQSKSAPLGGDRGKLSSPLVSTERAFSSLETLARECDIITIHTPLTTTGAHPTYHLIDDDVLHSLRRRPILINAGRGEVVDNAALELALDEGRVREAVIDTWEGEPDLRLSLLGKVFIGTPHIAGYSADGKANATRMSIQALCQWLQRPMTFTIAPPDLPHPIVPTDNIEELALQYYNPLEDSARLKAHPESFERLRGEYPVRREMRGEE